MKLKKLFSFLICFLCITSCERIDNGYCSQPDTKPVTVTVFVPILYVKLINGNGNTVREYVGFSKGSTIDAGFIKFNDAVTGRWTGVSVSSINTVEYMIYNENCKELEDIMSRFKSAKSDY